MGQVGGRGEIAREDSCGLLLALGLGDEVQTVRRVESKWIWVEGCTDVAACRRACLNGGIALRLGGRAALTLEEAENHDDESTGGDSARGDKMGADSRNLVALDGLFHVPGCLSWGLPGVKDDEETAMLYAAG